jgi:asparagine synthase (glutamine-hydrolysing)
MCGICGFSGDATGLTEADLLRMNDRIRRRGPDDSGHVLERGTGLAMRRLSILDLEGGHQPIDNEDHSVTVVYNGEIYNFRALREDLIARGHRFRTHGDTEVLVHLYEEYGHDMVGHLRGMFAFAILDRRDRSVFIARDRLGIKPLFWALHEGTLFFGSEIKSILAAGRVPTELDPQALDAYLTFTWIPAPLTIWKAIHKLRPGHHLVFREGRVEETQYWDVDFSQVDYGRDAREWASLVEEKLADAVASHLVSDVPLGAFLSGGVDSSLVVAMMAEATGQSVETFTMGFGGNTALIDERPYARLLSDRYPVRYNDFTVEPDFRHIFDEIVDAFDEPFADDSVIPSYYISQLTRQKVKVALSGLGGDELFGGYHRYRGLRLSMDYDRVPGFLRRGVVDPLVQRLPEPAGGHDRIDHMKRFSRAATLPPDQRYLGYVSSLDVAGRQRLYGPSLGEIDFARTAEFITGPFNACASNDILDRAFYTDLKTYLPDDILALSDRLSMWHSLELRVPLIDHELTELACRIPSSLKVTRQRTKVLLGDVASKWLPHDIIHHRKQGFESPMAAWMRGELREFTGGILGDAAVRETGLFDHGEIDRLFEEHCSGRRKNNKILMSLVMLFGWMKRNGVA